MLLNAWYANEWEVKLKRGYVDLPYGQMHYRTAGEGKVLLMLHQTPSSSDEYLGAMQYLSASFRVIAMDTLGHGMSDPPPRRYAIQDYADSVKDFLSALGINKASVLGHHTGATIAMAFAIAYPDMAENLIVSGFPFYEPADRKKKLETVSAVPPLGEDGAYIMLLWRALRTFNPSASVDEIKRLLISGLIAGPQGEYAHHAVFEYREQENLPKVKCPTLLISGTEDMFLKYMDATAKLIPHCTLATVQGGGSAIQLTRPMEFADTVLKFLAHK